MVTYKQIYHEVLEVIAQTYSFGATERIRGVEIKHDRPPNPLVMSDYVIRKLETQAKS